MVKLVARRISRITGAGGDGPWLYSQSAIKSFRLPCGRGALRHPPGVFKSPGPGRSGSKGRNPVVGIQRGSAASTSWARFITARNFLLRVQGPVPGRRKAGNREWRKARQARQARPGARRR